VVVDCQSPVGVLNRVHGPEIQEAGLGIQYYWQRHGQSDIAVYPTEFWLSPLPLIRLPEGSIITFAVINYDAGDVITNAGYAVEEFLVP
jgi:hypothetical protein